MVSVEGASLLAQVIPVLVLILVVEGRTLAGGTWDPGLMGRVIPVVGAATSVIAVFLSFLAEAYCISAVVSDTPVTAPSQVAVVVGGAWLIGAVAYVVAFMLALHFTGAWSWLYRVTHRED